MNQSSPPVEKPRHRGIDISENSSARSYPRRRFVAKPLALFFRDFLWCIGKPSRLTYFRHVLPISPLRDLLRHPLPRRFSASRLEFRFSATWSIGIHIQELGERSGQWRWIRNVKSQLKFNLEGARYLVSPGNFHFVPTIFPEKKTNPSHMLLLDGTYEAYSVYRSWISREVLGNIFRVLVQHGRCTVTGVCTWTMRPSVWSEINRTWLITDTTDWIKQHDYGMLCACYRWSTIHGMGQGFDQEQ